MVRIPHATLVFAALLTGAAGAAELPTAARALAVRRSSSITIDGRLDEDAWQRAPRQSGFIQRFPKDASAPSLDTRFAIVYDDDAIYVGVWADDPRPDLIRALLTRRDVESSADAVIVAFDSYHDRRTAYAFQLNAAGVQRDMLLFDDSNQDDTWDAVWTGDVAITPGGWTAEYRIPLSQLRFASGEIQQWGVQLVRTIGRTGEQDAWSPWPRSAPQVVSKFGVLEGIAHLGTKPRLELLPYVTGGFDRMPVEAGDPLNNRYGMRRNLGVDLKYGLGPAFTLSATINPDFGQVEADPSKVNLSASELFFAEKRPFFLEGVDLFKLAIGNSDNGVEGAFYSRRIGGAPPIPDIDYDFIKAPQSTVIYGAAKLTGKTASGWSLGVLDAVTGRESAQFATEGDANTSPSRQEMTVAPLTNYVVARLKRDLRGGETSVGISATAVNRRLEGTGLASSLHDQAYTGGLQLQHRWADNVWTANVNVLGSWVHGTTAAITETQTDSVHYFQRPDAQGVRLDPTRTSLSGLAAKWMIGQLGETKHWRYGFGGDLRTPGLELNDAGFQLESNRLIPFLYAEYREDAPSENVLHWQVNGDVFGIETLEPRLSQFGVEGNTSIQFSNYWSVNTYTSLDKRYWNVDALRGGRALRVDSSMFGNINISTDSRAAVRFNASASAGYRMASRGREVGLDLGATIQARSNVDLYLGPSVYRRDDPMQYIDQVNDDVAPEVQHFVFGRIRQTDLAMTVRANWTFSPHLVLQVYAQPYVSAGSYTELKDVDHPGAVRYRDRFRLLAHDGLTLDDDGTYHAARDGLRFQFDRPDFNFRQLRSTVVMRWEYRPGSTVFAIWSHGRTSDALDDGRFRFGRDLSDLATTRSENIIMVKANYWIGL